MSKNAYKLNPPPPQNFHYVSYNYLHASCRGLLILMGWGCPGGQGYTHDLARLIDFAISDRTSTVLSTLITKTTHLQGRWRVSFFWKRLKMYGMWMGRAGQSNSLCGTKTDWWSLCVKLGGGEMKQKRKKHVAKRSCGQWIWDIWSFNFIGRIHCSNSVFCLVRGADNSCIYIAMRNYIRIHKIG